MTLLWHDILPCRSAEAPLHAVSSLWLAATEGEFAALPLAGILP